MRYYYEPRPFRSTFEAMFDAGFRAPTPADPSVLRARVAYNLRGILLEERKWHERLKDPKAVVCMDAVRAAMPNGLPVALGGEENDAGVATLRR